MANYQSRYTGPEIDERLRKAGEAVLTEAQSLDAGKQAQARENIGAASSAAVDGKYTKPSGGIPKADLASGVQASLGKADTAYQKPASGIPASDIAEGVIPDVSQFVTKTVNDLANYYLKADTYTKDEVQQLISTIQGFSYEVVATLPAASADTMGKIYLVPSADPQSQNVKDEYITIDNGASAQTRYTWEQIGSTAVDLSGYVTTQQLNTALAAYTTSSDLAMLLEAKQDTISDLADIRSGSQNNVKYTQQTLTDAQKEQARANIDATAPEVFWAEYGATTQAQVQAAVADGKLVACYYDGRVYVYAGESNAGYSQFTSMLYDTAFRVYLKNSSWGNATLDIPTDVVKYAAQSLSDSQKAQARSNIGAGTYDKPSGGIPKSDLASGVQASLGKADTALQEHQDISGKADKVSGATSGDFAGLDSNGNLTDSGSKASDFATAAQGAKADSAYQKPQDGIPASDLEAGVIPTVPVRDVTLDDISVLDGTTAKLPAYPKSPRIFMGTCSTAAATVAKEATVEAFPLDANNKPLVGTVVGIKFSNTNSATAPTLNVNSTGAASIWYNNAAYEGKGAYGGSASRYIYYVWDGTYWAFQGWSYDADADTNTIGYNLRTNGGTAVAAAKFYRYRLLFTAPDGQSLVPSNTSSSTSTTAAKTVNQAKIDPFAPIWYYSTTTAVAAGASVSASYLWMQYSAIPLGYAFNRTGAALTMTARYPVYLKCAPQSDGSAIMDADTPIVQALPSTEDGKIYIFLGYAESEVNITLYYWHPVYYFKDGAIRQWTNAAAASITVDQTFDGTSANAQSGVAMAGALAEKQDTIDAQHKLDYGLLSNTPTIPAAQVNSDWNAGSGVAQILNKPNLATVATSGSYDDLSNKPVVDATPTANSNNLVKSGGVFDAIEDVMEAVDGSNVETVTVLPTASASTVGKIYYVGPDGNGEYARYRGIESGGSYSFLPLGSTAMDLSDYATKEDVDALNEVLDMEEVTSTENVPYTTTDQYITNYATPTIANSNQYCLTNLIHFDKGDIINASGLSTGSAKVVLVARYENGTWTKLLVGDTSQSTQSLEYTVTDDTGANIYFCWHKSATPTITKTKTEDVAHRLEDLDKIDPLEDRVDALDASAFASVEDDMTTGYVEGYFINHNGGLTGNSSFGYKEFTVRAGAVISITIAEHPNIAAIAKKVSEGKYVELVPATSYGEAVTYTYTATEDMTIAVSFYQTKARSITITTDYINSNRLNIVALQQEDASDEIRDIDFGFFFDKIAVIGDSMAVATMDGYSPTTGSAWLSFLAKRWNCTGKQFYASGGTGAYDWLNSNTYGLGKMLADETVYNAYFIAYGHNDSASVGEATDAAAPVTVSGGMPSCPSGYSFCAYLKAIVAQIRQKAPHAMIFMLSQYDYSVAPGGWHSQYGEAVIAVAEALYAGGDKLVHHLDTGGVPDADMRIGSHYSTVGYAYIAKRVNDEVNKVMYQYRADTEIKTFGVYNL